MAPSSIKIHEECIVSPHEQETQFCLPLTYFDLFWLRFHPVERVFYFTLHPHHNPSFFYDHIIPNLKTSLSQTLQRFLPLAGNIVWPTDAKTPIVQYTPGDGVSFVVAESSSDLEGILDNSPRDASESRSFVPHLEASDSKASVMSLQITLFPGKGFSIGISTHHAVLDGKSSTMFIKAWASLSQQINENQSSSLSLVRELEPCLDREVVKDPNDLGVLLTNSWTEVISKMLPSESNTARSLRILPFEPKVEDSVRATFELTRGDLEKLKKKVLSKWDVAVNEGEQYSSCEKPPTNLSTFVVTCGHAVVCMAKAIQRVEHEREKFGFVFSVDYRARLEPPLPDNYFGNCVWGQFPNTNPRDFVEENGVVIVTKSIHSKIKSLEKGDLLEGAESGFQKFVSLTEQRVEIIGVAGSNRFGVYGVDFGWGKAHKVEIVSVDRGLTVGLADTKDGKDGVEVGVVLNKDVMRVFCTLFREGLSDV